MNIVFSRQNFLCEIAQNHFLTHVTHLLISLIPSEIQHGLKRPIRSCSSNKDGLGAPPPPSSAPCARALCSVGRCFMVTHRFLGREGGKGPLSADVGERGLSICQTGRRAQINERDDSALFSFYFHELSRTLVSSGTAVGTGC